MYRHHPQWRTAKELVQTGQIGALRAIQVFFSFYKDDPRNIRYDSATGGGVLMDIGCYATSLSRWLFNAEPQRVFGLLVNDPRFGVDCLVSAMLDFGVGHATFTCSMQVAPFQQVHVAGVAGHIELSEAPFNPPDDPPASSACSGAARSDGWSWTCVTSIRSRAIASPKRSCMKRRYPSPWKRPSATWR